MNKLQPNQNHRLDNITKLQSPNDKMTLLNLINQEHNKTKHIIIEKDKFKSVLNQINKQSNKQSKLRKSIELYESSELLHESSELYESSELLHESSESYESSELQESNSEFIMKTEIVEIENHNLEFDNIYANKEKEEIVYYDNQPKLKTVAKIMYSKHNLDQLIKKKKW
jgi:hypothetical protein